MSNANYKSCIDIKCLMSLSIATLALFAVVPMTAYGYAVEGQAVRATATNDSTEMIVGQYKAKKFNSSRTPAGQRAKYRPTPAGKPVKPNPAGTPEVVGGCAIGMAGSCNPSPAGKRGKPSPAGKRTKPNPAGTPELAGGCAIGMAGSCNPR